MLQSSDDPLFSETIHNLKKTGGLYEVPQKKRWVSYSQPVYDTGFVLASPLLSLLALGAFFQGSNSTYTLYPSPMGPFFQVSNSTYSFYPDPRTILQVSKILTLSTLAL